MTQLTPNSSIIERIRGEVGLPTGRRVAVAMSGGVDSSVVAGLLVEAGYEVIGLTARLYDVDPVEAPRPGACCAPEDARDARAVAARLGFRHYVLDERDSFYDEVIAPFVKSWREGETPNPCVSCNRSLKFDRLLRRALALGAEVLATGHYARLDADDAGSPRLRRGRDRDKDQAYFLYPLPSEQAHLLRFPLGDMSKSEVRSHAERLDLAVADKPESMDVCFVGGRTVSQWVAAQGEVPRGSLVSLSGTRLGQHSNLAQFTVGQRRGLGLPGGGGVQYVVDKRADGTVVIGGKDDLLVAELELAGFNAVTGELPPLGAKLGLQVRHRANPIGVTVTSVSHDRLTVQPTTSLFGAARGQAGVLFADDRVVGGGTIEGVRRLSENPS